MHCFFIFAIIWSFGVNLRSDHKGEFEVWINDNCTVNAEKKEKKKKKGADESES